MGRHIILTLRAMSARREVRNVNPSSDVAVNRLSGLLAGCVYEPYPYRSYGYGYGGGYSGAYYGGGYGYSGGYGDGGGEWHHHHHWEGWGD